MTKLYFSGYAPLLTSAKQNIMFEFISQLLCKHIAKPRFGRLKLKYHPQNRNYQLKYNKMRLTALLAWRKASAEPVPFQERLPLKLKPTVSGKGDKISEVCCIQEMSVMLACFKTYEFNQALCSSEIDKFKQCYTNHMNIKRVKKEHAEKGILTPGEKKLSYKQVNILLKKHPNHI